MNRSTLTKQVPAADTPSQASLMTLAVSVVVIGALFLAREVLIPVTLAVLLSFVLGPLVMWLRHKGLRRGLAVLLVVLLAFGVIGALGTVIGTQVAQLIPRAPYYAYTFEQKLTAARTFAAQHMEALTGPFGQTDPPAPPPGRPSTAPAPVPVEVRKPDPSPFELIERIGSPLLGPLGSLGIVLVVAVFVLMQSEDLRDRMIRLFGSHDLHRTTAAMDDAASRLSRYFLAQLSLNAAFGVVVTLGLFLIGVPSPALFGIIAGLLRFVPYVGSVGGAGLPMLLAAAVDPGWRMALEVAALFLVIEPVTGQLIEPLLYGHRTGLSPVSVVVSAIFWAWLWGPVGLILSMPLTLCLVVLGRHVQHLEFLDVLLGDRPALTPAESFYQRMLAGDADEALDQAEQILRDQPLSAYYDEVAMAGLQMAANDRLRGVLTTDQLRHIQESIASLVVDLAAHDDEGGNGGTGSTTVVCVAGRGALDTAACTMLAQLLTKHGLDARVVSSEAVSRMNVDTLDLTGAGALCVSYIEGAASLPSLRYLMRRLRQRAPGLPTVIGLWHADQATLQEEPLRAITGADLTTTSLREAVAACVAAAQPVPASLASA